MSLDPFEDSGRSRPNWVKVVAIAIVVAMVLSMAAAIVPMAIGLL